MSNSVTCSASGSASSSPNTVRATSAAVSGQAAASRVTGELP
ncbi:hypothetical protein [Streptomyces hokutonensis]